MSRIRNKPQTTTSKSTVQEHVSEGLADLAAGRTHGPYETAAEAIAAVEKLIKGKGKGRELPVVISIIPHPK